jgi:hypothetical protein
MKARKKWRRRPTGFSQPAPAQEETRASLMVTVVWMLGTLCTFGAEVVGVFVNTIVVVTQSAPTWLQAVSETLFMVALITGLMSLVITPVCLKIRHAPPPKPITLLAVAIATMPLLTLVVRSLWS